MSEFNSSGLKNKKLDLSVIIIQFINAKQFLGVIEKRYPEMRKRFRYENEKIFYSDSQGSSWVRAEYIIVGDYLIQMDGNVWLSRIADDVAILKTVVTKVPLW